MSGVCVVGSLHYDIVLQAPYVPRTGETLMGDAWWWKPGGKGGNQAMAASRHGAQVEMIGRLGDDSFGARLGERLEAAGVGTGEVRTVAQPSGMSVAIQEATGDYAAIVVSGANLDIDEAQVNGSRDAIESCRVLVLQNEIASSANVAAARLAKDAGVLVILNAAPARAMDGLEGLVGVVVANAIEAEMLGADTVDDLASAAAAADRLAGMAETVVVTAGAHGLAAIAGHERLTIEAHETSRAETHGAGDVFVGTLAARLAMGDAHDRALHYANAAAALHVGASEPERDALGPLDVRRLL